MPFGPTEGPADIEHTMRYIFSGIHSEYNIEKISLEFVDEGVKHKVFLQQKNELCGCDWCTNYFDTLKKIISAETVDT